VHLVPESQDQQHSDLQLYLSLGAVRMRLSSYTVAIFASLLTAAKGSALKVIQAQAPPRMSFEGTSCRQTIFNHSFASSYGIPYVGTSSSLSLPTFHSHLLTIKRHILSTQKLYLYNHNL
jgi:hypothetical protein